MSEILNQFPAYLRHLIFFNTLTIIVSVMAIIVYGIITRYYRRHTKDMKDVLMEILEEILFDHKKVTPELLSKFKSTGLAKSKSMQKILQIILMQYSLFVKGEERALINKIFLGLHFDKQELRKIHSRFPKHVIKAVNKLGRFNVYIDRDIIKKLQHSPNAQIREVANLYTVGFYRDEIFEFFEFTPEPLTPWQQLELYHVFIARRKVKVPEFSRWIRLEYDPSIIKLSSELAVHFSQQDASFAIENIVRNCDKKLRVSLITALGKLGHINSIQFLIGYYEEEEDLNCRKAIVESLSYLPDDNLVVPEFLSKIKYQEESILLQKAIFEAQSKTRGANFPLPLTLGRNVMS